MGTAKKNSSSGHSEAGADMDSSTAGTSPTARPRKETTSMTTRLHVLPAALLFAAAAAAQLQPLPQSSTTVNRRDADFAVDVGNAQYGTNISMQASAETRVTSILGIPYGASARLDDSVVGRVRLGGVNREAAAVTSFGSVAGNVQFAGLQHSYAAGFALRIGGQTVLSPSFSGTQTTPIAWNSGTGTLTFLQTAVSVPTPLGFNVNLGLTGRASASIGALLQVDPPQLTATLTGDLRGVATGIASASVAVLCAEAGVSFQLNLLNTRLSPSVTASYQNGPSGTFGYRVEAARFLINLFVSLCGLNASVPVVDMTFGVFQGTRTLL
jgi:hypothetical protein